MQSLIERFIEHLEQERNLSPHTIRAYRADLKRFIAFLAGEFYGVDRESLSPQGVDVLAKFSYRTRRQEGVCGRSVAAREFGQDPSQLGGISVPDEVAGSEESPANDSRTGNS